MEGRERVEEKGKRRVVVWQLASGKGRRGEMGQAGKAGGRRRRGDRRVVWQILSRITRYVKIRNEA